MNETRFLIIRKQLVAQAVLEQQVRQLATIMKGDPYSIRLALLGFGLGLLQRGSEDELEATGRLLNDQGYAWSIFDPALLPSPALLVRNFEIRQGSFVLETAEGSYILSEGRRVLAVVADLEGRLLTRMMRQRTYRGEVVAMSIAEKYKSIVSGDPVLDLYLLPASFRDRMQATGPLRIIPGKFKPDGLGVYATQSSKLNLDRVVRLCQSFAGKLAMEMDFGLFELPGCRLEKGKSETARLQNLDSLSVYGEILLNFYRQRHQRTRTGLFPVSAPSAGAAGILLASAKADKRKVENVPLPPPPALVPTRPIKTFFSPWNIAAIFLFTFAAGGLSFFVNTTMPFWDFMLRYGVQTGVLPLALAASCFWGGFHYLRLKRWIDQTPTSKLRSAAMGMVEVKGVCHRVYNLLSPVSHLPCVYYRLKTYERKRSGKNTHWQMISDVNSGPVPFLLKDDTGSMLVDPSGAKVSCKQTLTQEDSIPGGLLNSNPYVLGGEQRTVEEIIPEGSTVYVMGYADQNREERKDWRRRVAEKLKALKNDPERLLAFDADKDGRIDETEWETARRAVEHEILGEWLNAPNSAAKSAVLIRKPPKRGLPFLVVEGEEGGLTFAYGLFGSGLLAAALGLTAWGLLMLYGWAAV